VYLVEDGLNDLVRKGGEVIDERLKEDESARRANGGAMAAQLGMI